MNQKRSKLKVILISAALALLTSAAYEQVRNCGFVNYDDDKYVYENQHVKDGLTVDDIKWAFTATYASNWHPLTWLSHMLDCQLFGVKPGWHHLTNVLFHIANTLLLFIVLNRMTKALWRSALVAAAFALHPLHVESVAWIAERKDVLSGFFWMLTMWAYVRYTEQPGIKRYLLVLLFFALGLMAKPMLVTLPFVLLLLDYWPLGRLQRAHTDVERNISPAESAGLSRRTSSVRHLLVEKVPLFLLSVASSVVTYIAQQRGGGIPSTGGSALKFRLVNALTSYFGYIVKMFYPTNLAAFYPYPRTFHIDVMIVLLIVVLVLLGRWARRRPWLMVGLLWYIGTLVPVIGIVQVGIQAMADRYTYLPSIGIFIVVAWGAAELAAGWRFQKVGLGVAAGLVLTVLAICTREQVKYWQSDMTLFEHAIKVTKDNWEMEGNYGAALFRKGRINEAIEHYGEALRINPGFVMARLNMGVALLKQGKADKAAACFEGVLRAQPNNIVALNDLGILLRDQGKIDEAVKNFEKIIQVDSRYYLAYYNIAIAEARQGEYNQAIKHLQAGLRIKPNWPDAYAQMGKVWLSMGNANQAVACWRRALNLNPAAFWVLDDLARTLATAADPNLRNPADAVKYAQRACQLTNYSQPPLLDTLAAAYAGAGDFPEAAKVAEKAVKLAETNGEKELAQRIQEHLDLYKSSKSAHEK
jgi:tetratricopeptide (TPR) repeat protein